MNIKSEITAQTLKKLEKMMGVRLTLGKLMWAIRQADEISQVVFAKKLHLTKQHLCDIERGRKLVSPELAAKYAGLLGYSKEQFIRLSLQDSLDRLGLHVEIEVRKKSPKKMVRTKKAA